MRAWPHRHAAMAVLATTALALTGCSSGTSASIAPKPGAPPVAAYAPLEKVDYRLPKCLDDSPGAVRQTAKAATALTGSWFEIVRHIRQCDIDQVRYYNGEESFSAVLDPLAELSVTGPAPCRSSAVNLAQRLRTIHDEITDLSADLNRICQIDDAMGDYAASQSRLDRALGSLCAQIDALGSNRSCG